MFSILNSFLLFLTFLSSPPPPFFGENNRFKNCCSYIPVKRHVPAEHGLDGGRSQFGHVGPGQLTVVHGEADQEEVQG